MKGLKIISILLAIGTNGFLILNKKYALTDYKTPLFSVPTGQVRIDFVNKSNKKLSLFLYSLLYQIKLKILKSMKEKASHLNNREKGLINSL